MPGRTELLESHQTETEPECTSESSLEDGSHEESGNPASSWWRRPCGGREVVLLSLPLMVSMFSYSVMQFCDRMFLSWESPDSLAAVMPAGVMVWTLLAFPFGLALYTNVFVAQYFGAKNDQRIGQVLWHGLILASLFFPIFIFSAVAPELVFRWAGHDPVMVGREAIYFRYMAFGSMGNVIASVLSAFFIGQGRTTITMLVDVWAAAFNIVLDILLIFGFAIGTLFALEPMGIQGAAIATSIALSAKALVLLVLILQKKNIVRFGLLNRFKFQPELIWRMFRFGSSNGIQFLVECIGIAAFALMIGRLGSVQSAATTVAISINMLVFVPIFGLSTAISTIVGQQIGRGKPALAERATWTSMVIAVSYTCFFGLSYVLFPTVYMLGFSTGADQFEATANLVRWLLVFVAAYCIFD